MLNEKEKRILKIIGSRIRELRKNRRNLSQDKFALEAGLERAYYGRIERGERNISLLNILKISHALGVHPGEIFPDEERNLELYDKE